MKHSLQSSHVLHYGRRRKEKMHLQDGKMNMTIFVVQLFWTYSCAWQVGKKNLRDHIHYASHQVAGKIELLVLSLLKQIVIHLVRKLRYKPRGKIEDSSSKIQIDVIQKTTQIKQSALFQTLFSIWICFYLSVH